MDVYPTIGEASYKDPMELNGFSRRSKKPENPKVLCVVCTHFPGDWDQVTYHSRDRDHEYHVYEHNRLHCLQFVLACHEHYDAGVEYDLVLVNNGSLIPNAEGFSWHDSNDNIVRFARYRAEQNQAVTFFERPNTFFSFGAYKYAFDKWGKEYDYFVFQEMDWAPAHDGWLTQFIDMWEADKRIGMIGNLIERHHVSNADPIPNYMKVANPHRDDQFNLDSEYFFTSREVLDAMPRWNIFPCEPEGRISPAVNELAFQQPLLEMGLKLRCFNDGRHTMFYCLYNRAVMDKWDHGLDRLAPFVPEQARLFCPEMQKHFDWYEGPTSLTREKP